jgi:hypothetical protein
MSFKTMANEKAVFINQDEGMFIAMPITLDPSIYTLETVTRTGRTIVKSGSVVKESTVVRGILAEEYDITDGPAAARVVVRGYCYASRLTDAAIAAVASLPEIYLMPYKTAVVALDSVDGLKATLHLEGAKWASTAVVGNFTVGAALTLSGVAVDADNNNITLIFAAAGTADITAIAAGAFAGATGATLKGLPISVTVGA